MYSKELISQVIKTNKYNIHVATCWVKNNQFSDAQVFLDKYLQCDIELNQYLNDEIAFEQMSPNSIMYFEGASQRMKMMYSKELISQVIKTNKYNIHVATCWVKNNKFSNAQVFLDKYLQCDIELNQYLNDEITFEQMSPNSIMYFEGLK